MTAEQWKQRLDDCVNSDNTRNGTCTDAEYAAIYKSYSDAWDAENAGSTSGTTSNTNTTSHAAANGTWSMSNIMSYGVQASQILGNLGINLGNQPKIDPKTGKAITNQQQDDTNGKTPDNTLLWVLGGVGGFVVIVVIVVLATRKSNNKTA
jgi:hypothetical protein